MIDIAELLAAQASGKKSTLLSADPIDAMLSAQSAAQSPVETQPVRPNTFAIKGDDYDKIVNYSGKDAIGGAARGAGSIGATLLAPIDAAARFVNGGKPISMFGYDIAGQDRRQGMDAGLDSAGVNRESSAFQTNKLGAEIAGTSGVGGLLANGIRMIPGASSALPTLLPAIESGGMLANGAKGAQGMTARIAGGSVNGASTAGLVNPDDTGSGMLFGSAIAPVAKILGTAGQYLGSALKPNPGANPTKLATARDGMDAGYVVPPNMLKPSLANQVIESISGKQATQQIASMRNSDVTEGLVRKALGIADDVPLTQSTMESLRKTAYQVEICWQFNTGCCCPLADLLRRHEQVHLNLDFLRRFIDADGTFFS